MSSEVSEALRRLVADRAYHVCEYCLVHEQDVYHGCEVDHVRSVKHGGRAIADNLAFACFHCNRHKGTDLGSVSARTGALVRFYNPRTDRWSEHFQANEGRIEPLTDIGEVTVRLLEFNHPERVAFRKMLAETGRYPTVEALALLRG
jgi:hypothetical protein